MHLQCGRPLVRFLGREDPLEKGMATHSSVLAWRIPWTSPWGHKESERTERLSHHFCLLLQGIILTQGSNPRLSTSLASPALASGFCTTGGATGKHHSPQKNTDDRLGVKIS